MADDCVGCGGFLLGTFCRCRHFKVRHRLCRPRLQSRELDITTVSQIPRWHVTRRQPPRSTSDRNCARPRPRGIRGLTHAWAQSIFRPPAGVQSSRGSTIGPTHGFLPRAVEMPQRRQTIWLGPLIKMLLPTSKSSMPRMISFILTRSPMLFSGRNSASPISGNLCTFRIGPGSFRRNPTFDPGRASLPASPPIRRKAISVSAS